nr:FecR domain-containing protein [uncultured Duganella sp.]
MTSKSKIEPGLLKEAAAWLVLLRSDTFKPEDGRKLEEWSTRSEAHARAWSLARQLTEQIDAIPKGMPVHIDTPSSTNRRAVLRGLGVVAVGGGAALMAARAPWSSWTAGYQTATGERQSVDLDNGATLILNTASALDVDRRTGEVWLRDGELLLTRAVPASLRGATPFSVHTGNGRVTVNGRSNVRVTNGMTRVAAIRGEATIEPGDFAAAPRVVGEGEAVAFSRDGIVSAMPVSPNDDVWTMGLIEASSTRLGDFIDQLKRYHRTIFRCHPDVADLPVSGLFQISDLRRILALLNQNYPIRIETVGSLWVRLLPA